MEDKALFDHLVKQNIISQVEAGRLLSDAALSGKDAELMLYERRLADDVVIAQTKAELMGIPFKRVDPATVTDEAIAFVPSEVAGTYLFVPLKKTEDTLIVGMVKPKDSQAQEALRFIGKQQKVNLGVYLISYTDFQTVLQKFSPFKNEVAEALSSIEDQMKGSKAQESIQMVELDKESGVKESAPIIRLAASILKQAIAERVSDIHIEPQRTRLRVRFRGDGDLKEVLSLPLPLHQPIVSRIKVLSGLKIDENRRPQDGRFRTAVFNKEIDFRVSTFPTAVGEKVVMRVLDPTAGLKSITDLGLIGKNLETLKKTLDKPYGMILITGPTGSGKTTSLYSMLTLLNQDDVNIITLEDPVEYTLAGLNQSQVMPEIGYTFASGLRQILRQDPDIIMVGEIRDGETAELAIHAALTGHLVLSTLHTNNALGVAPRLIDMRVEPFLLSAALNIMIAQRLVSKLCPDCKKSKEASPEMTALIDEELAKFPEDARSYAVFKKPYMLYEPVGCSECKHKGVRGRMAIFEVLVMTPTLDEIINTGITELKMLEEAKRQGMITLRQDGILKVLNGDVSIVDVLRESSETN